MSWEQLFILFAMVVVVARAIDIVRSIGKPRKSWTTNDGAMGIVLMLLLLANYVAVFRALP